MAILQMIFNVRSCAERSNKNIIFYAKIRSDTKSNENNEIYKMILSIERKLRQKTESNFEGMSLNAASD